jgi:hypothetical protein
MSAKLVVTLSAPKPVKKAPAQPDAAPVKRVRAPKVAPVLVEFGLAKDGADVLITTRRTESDSSPAEWTYRLSPKAVEDYNTPWENLLGIEDRQELDGVLLTLGDRTLVDFKRCAARNVQLAIALYSLVNLSPQ